MRAPAEDRLDRAEHSLGHSLPPLQCVLELTPQQIEDAFNRADTNSDGVLSRQEFEAAITNAVREI